VYFKSLELVGFKSFAERTVIGFEPGITAVVGPNGCGKSNVSDAIRWVLGEQSARSLRGTLMEDLIFNGSGELEPMGMAEVSLTLGDAGGLTEEEYDEVTVSRRLFRSGESQYFLNKRSCRLKDVHRLFMNSGLGTQAYSFMQQGNIELILSSKPEDRRFLFDETAGITRYKACKKEAMRRLEETEANLLRSNDRLRDVKRQMISSQRQAGKARRYKEFADELQRLEVGLLLQRRGRFAEDLKSLEKKRQGVEAILRRLARDIEQRESRVREIRAHFQGGELSHEELQSRKLDLLRSIDRESGKISLFEQRIADTRSLSENMAAEMAKMCQKAADLEAAIGERKGSLQGLSSQRLSCDEKLTHREEELNEIAGELRQEEALLAEVSNRLLDLIRRETEIRSRVSSLGEISDRNKQALAELSQQNKGVLSSLAEKEEAHRDAQTDRDALCEELERQKDILGVIRQEMKKAEEGLRNLRSEILRSEREVSRVEREVSRVESERSFLTEAIEGYDGYEAGVQSLMEESRREESRLTGIMGTVGDVLEIPQELGECIKSVLEDRVQWVLVKTMDDAKRAAAYLRQETSGRATFLALDRVEPPRGAREAARKLCFEKGAVLRPILDLVSFDGRYEKVMGYLLGDVILAPDFDEAMKAAEQSGSELTFVAPSGEKIAGGRVITVGRSLPAAQLALFNGKSRLAHLAVEEDARRKQLDDLRRREEDFLRMQRELAQKADRQVSLISGVEGRIVHADRNLLDLSASISSLRNRGVELEARRRQMECEQERLEQERRILAEELKGVSSQRSQVEATLSSTRATVESLQKDAASAKRDLAEIAPTRASYDERIANLQSDMEYMRGQLDLTKKEIENRSRQIEQGKKYISELQGEIQACHSAIATQTQERERIASAIEQLDERRKLLADELTQVEWEVKEKTNAAREREKEIAELQLKLAELRLSIKGIDERLMAEHGMTSDDPKAVPLPEESDMEEVRSTIAELKNRLQSMGPVNLCAIEQYEELRREHDFLVTQHKDLLQGRDSLLKAIAKLDRESKAIFRQAFERIREEFQDMFQRLFGGGRADLLLLDESDILESGIEIIARPPGKKLQSISLLSGGERAMTAISLLFAIFKVKPSPFCVLDEIDAPLDDSNIVRFAEVLKEFAEKSQFIIITHNKRTIAASDVLYGITMEDSGISKVVSARLTRRKEEASVSNAGASSA